MAARARGRARGAGLGASPQAPAGGLRRRVIAFAATAAAGALLIALAIAWPGFDARETPADSGSIWALQSGDGRRYARVNLLLDELDTVKGVENPSGLVQASDRLLVYTDGDARFADVDLARPSDLGAEADEAFRPTPSGTIAVSSAGGTLAYLTDSGAVFGASLSRDPAPVPIDPYAGDAEPGQERRSFDATAVAAAPGGQVFAYSASEGRVIRADATTGQVTGSEAVPEAPVDAVQLTSVGDRWVLMDAATGDVWVQGGDAPVPSGATGGLLQRAGEAGPEVAYIADPTGLVAVSLDGSGASRIIDDVNGTPAAPTPFAGSVWAAWLPASGGGTLWSSGSSAAGQAGTRSSLDYAGASLGDEIAPEFWSNGSRMILNETRAGWVWAAPEGRLIPSSQRWEPEDQAPPTSDEQVEAERVIDPKPPVAVNDEFGVRAGRTVVLPVLLNDHDPNEDVLSIRAGSIEGLPPEFGTVAPGGEQQSLVVTLAAGATGSATLRYRVTDGTTNDGLDSEPATVTLTVAGPEQNSAPVWCGVPGCLAEWPNPQVRAGGTTQVDVLKGWVDPEGDPMYVAAVLNPSGIGTAAVDPQGLLTYQHPDPNARESMNVPLTVRVSDAAGALAEQVLNLTVTPSPALTAESFAVTGPAGQPLTVDVRSHVTGASGALRLTGVRPLDEQSGQASIVQSGGTFSFRGVGTNASSALVQYTVADERGEATATVRITLLDPTQAQISSPPLTAFVRPGEDTTVDLLSAVSNPAGLVLLASDVQSSPDQAASLQVDLVGQRMLRVTGGTDSGEPGVLGVVRYRVSDGTGNGFAETAGELTAILLPAAGSEPPIAVDDAATVRAGGQVDIPVLENDTSPAGTLIALDPTRVSMDAEGALAFASGRLVRVLAPGEPGVYRISYTVYRVGFPSATDTAEVVLTVTARDANVAPAPETLVGRVLSGSTVSIPFDRFGVDPDGDTVALDRIVSQPDRGSAAISAEGDAIVYTSAPGDRGQVSFTYQVRDSQGATGTAEVRVGVLDAASDPSPITYSDYVQVQVGADNTTTVRPTDNDIDPAGSALELLDVRPNAEVGTGEYERLAAQLQGIEDGRVTLRAGDELGTSSFVYTVRNTSGDTAIGLIVLKVVRDAVPDYPLVRDTTLTAETREDFPRGVDVLAGRVVWGGGDPGALQLALWQAPPDVTASGSRITGAVPEESIIVPFEVRGTAFDGREVVSYAFLRVPGTRAVQLFLRPAFSRIEVNEKGQAELDLAAAIAAPRGEQLVVDASRVSAGGGRAEGRCEMTGPLTLRYTAGAGSPYTDSCTVPVKLASQDVSTFLSVHVDVIAAEPQPQLRPASIAVSPGDTAVFSLADMTTWAGRADQASLAYAISYAGDQFTVAREGATVSITAKDAARPGREEPVTVTIPASTTTLPATLTLTVGPAPSTLPKGGSAQAQCSQGGGSLSCEVTVIGIAGEVNPLPGTALRLASVAPASNCQGVTFEQLGDTRVRASWGAETPGAASCRGTFSVIDAQGRVSAGDRDGQVIVDLRGLPADPSRIVWTEYSASTVTLRVSSDVGSYPAVTGYRVTGAGGQVTCGADGICPPIGAPELGRAYSYEVRALNEVGESRRQVSVQAWSYAPPAAPTSISARPTPTGDGSGGFADVVLDGIDPSTARIELAGPAGTQTLEVPAGSRSLTFARFPTGGNQPVTLTATPLTSLNPPTQFGAQNRGSQVQTTAFGLGTPGLELQAVRSENTEPGRLTATATVRANGPKLAGVRLFVGFSDNPAACTPNREVDAAGAAATQVFGDLPLWQRTTVYACAEHRFDASGGASFGRANAEASGVPIGTIPTPTGDASYRIRPGVQLNGQVALWREISSPNLQARWPFELRYSGDNGASWVTPDAFGSLVRLGANSTIVAAACHPEFGCSAAVPVKVNEASAAPYPVQATFTNECTEGEPRSPQVTAPATAFEVVKTFTPAGWFRPARWEIEVRWLDPETPSGFENLNNVKYEAPECPAPPTPTPTPSATATAPTGP